MLKIRKDMIIQAKKRKLKIVGFILGTLGRQGNPRIL